MTLTFNQKFESRREVSALLGGDLIKGITTSTKIKDILLFTNEEEIYTDYFYPKGTHNFCMYTGIGRRGHQDSVNNNMYKLNIDVLTHQMKHKKLLVFESKDSHYYFVGEYQLLETHQNVQPDEENNLRRVFVFHLERICDSYKIG